MGIKQKGFIGNVVANEPNNNGVPNNGSGARKSIKQLASKVGLSFLAELAKARSNGGGLEIWERDRLK